jgi:DNA-binding NarL/FixJ family response regulator
MLGGDSQSRAPIQVVIADDHVTMRKSLRLLLEGEPDISVVAEAGDLGEAARGVHDLRPNVLVIDPGLARAANPTYAGTGLELTAFVRAIAPEAQVVLVTMHEHRAFAEQALDAVVLGVIRKDLAENELPDAVRAAARGERYTSTHFLGLGGG